MSLTPSTMLPLGTIAPGWVLPDAITGRMIRFPSAVPSGTKAVLIAFLCNHCPYVKHIRDPFGKLAREYADRNVVVYAISSNDIQRFPQDAPPFMVTEARAGGYTFPYLFDESQQVAKAYRAACTPDFFLFDSGLRLVYRGQMDGSRPGSDVQVTGRDLRLAMDAVLDGRSVQSEQLPSIGCNIKWKPGNEPEYFG